MKYLSRVFIHKNEAVRNRLRDNYAWHQAIWKVFLADDDKKRDFLFRTDDLHPYFRLLLLSEQRPTVPEWGSWETSSISGSFLKHNRYRFQIRANPTMRRASDRRRIGIYAEPRLREWFARKATDNGFEVDKGKVGLTSPVEETFFRNGSRGKHISVDFQGVMKVWDQKKLESAFKKGIGPAKAFGFGMLMLQPLVQAE